MIKLKKVACVLLAAACVAGACACGTKAEEEDNEPIQYPEKVLLIGDSLFDFWEGLGVDLAGAPRLANIAIGGTDTVYWCGEAERAERLKPTKILICLGTNDIGNLRRTGEATARGGDRYENSCLQGMLELYHEKIPYAYFYLLTINICGEPNRWDRREDARTSNAIMREYCASKDWVEIVETENAFYDDNDYTQKPNPDYFMLDYLHFSIEGYKVFTRIIRGALKLDQGEQV